MSETKQIDYVEIYPSNGTWMVRYTSEPTKSRIAELMGTNEIPTPFTTVRSFDEVFQSLRSIPANANTCFVEAGR